MTARLGVIGDPVSHSLSPAIHNGWLARAGIDAIYEAIHVPAGALPEALTELSSQAVRGLNITLPHKGAALAYSKMASEAALAVGAANTLTWTDGVWKADNTDVPGVLRALELAGHASLTDQSILLLGAGGAARAVAYALAMAGSKVTVLNRTVDKAEGLATDFLGPDAVSGPIDQLTHYLADADLVINTLSLCHTGRHVELSAGDGRLFLDISYGKAADGQLAEAARRDWRTEDGLAMLVAQAAESFKIWFDIIPDVDAALKRCRALVEAV